MFAEPIAIPRSPSRIRKLDNETAAGSGMTSGRMVDLMEIGSDLVGGFASNGVYGDGGVGASEVRAPAPMAVWTDIRSGAGEGLGAAWALLPILSSIRLWRRIPAGE